MSETDTLLTVSEVAALMQVGHWVVRKRIQDGELPIVDVEPIRIRLSDLEALIAKYDAIEQGQLQAAGMRTAKEAARKAAQEARAALAADKAALRAARKAQRAARPKPPRRKQISPNVRALVIARDGLVCQLCHFPILYASSIAVDHIIPVTKGGSDNVDNLRVAHRFCNVQRGNRPDWTPPTQWRFYYDHPRKGEQPLAQEPKEHNP